MRKFPKIITGVLFWGLVCVPVSGFAEKNKNDYHPEHREFRYGENVCFVG